MNPMNLSDLRNLLFTLTPTPLPGNPLRGRESQDTREGEDLDRDRVVSSELPGSSNENQSREGSFHSRQSVSDSRLPTPGSRQGSVPTRSSPWDRDEWDIAMADGTVYRLFVEREVGQWFLEGVFD